MLAIIASKSLQNTAIQEDYEGQTKDSGSKVIWLGNDQVQGAEDNLCLPVVKYRVSVKLLPSLVPFLGPQQAVYCSRACPKAHATS